MIPRTARSARTALASIAAATALFAPMLFPAGGAVAAPTTDASSVVPVDQYSFLAADSEALPWPAPPALDGTGPAAFDDDVTSEWSSASAGQSHWIAFDTGATRTLTGLQYSVKAQDNGPIKDFAVYTTNDETVASSKTGDWGTPVATGTFKDPTGNDQIQTVTFDAPVSARYVKLESISSISGTPFAAASELRVLASDDTDSGGTDPVPPVDGATAVVLSNGSGLSVDVAEEFPQVIDYSVGGHSLDGQAKVLDTFAINGKDHVATTTMTSSGVKATYVSTFADLPDLSVTSTITVTDKDTVVFEMTKLEGSEAANVDEISIPDQSLVSVDSADASASLARTKISTDSTTTADQFIPVTGSTAVDKKPVGTPYGFVNNSQVAAGIITNATDDSAQGSNTNWNTRLQSQIVDAGNGAKRAELSVGNWTYAPKGATDPRVKVYALPKATIVLANDANSDGSVDWQDAAIAYRDAMTHPLGADRVADRVVQHIPFNFASQATNPFLKTLDNVKRISMTTDDLGQWVLEKGYANEGHDSGHPDYGGDYNIRAGGLSDLNTLTDIGKKYNTEVGVHVNASEAYAQAKQFDPDLLTGGLGWDWINQAYTIDQRKDLGTGAIIDRFKELRKEAPGIKTVYVDAYLSSGWLADGLSAQLHDMGFEVATEYANRFVDNSIWSHWANDKNYGGNQGLTSKIARFISNSDTDIWNVDPVLGGESIPQFEGWQGANDYNTFYKTIWTENLPTKFLQHFPVMEWDFGSSASLADDVDVSMVDGKRQISMGGAIVATGDTYLLPWADPADGNEATSPADANKMYYYNAAGGDATFTLTPQFAGNTDFTLYKLTDQGRVKVSNVSATNGKVTLSGDKATPYVLAPNGAKAPHADANYGEGSGVVDPGFNTGNLDAWNATGGAKATVTDNGDNVASLGTEESSISQKITGLSAGKQYSVSANVEIAKGERRSTTLSANSDGTITRNAFDTTPAQNKMASDAKENTYSQRASVTFTAPANGTVTIALGAVAGDTAVTLDDVRVMLDTDKALPESGKVIAQNDFEGNQPGWGPFIKGDAGGTTDPRTSISDLTTYSQKEWKNEHPPYDAGDLDGKAVDDVLDGSYSLKAHEENDGLVYRTIPATVPFVAGHKYSVSFDYQTNIADQWTWVTGSDSVGGGTVSSTVLDSTPMEPALNTATYSQDIVAGCGDTWVGLQKSGGAHGADFVLDNFTVTDLGEAAGGSTCGRLTTPQSASLSPGVPSEFATSFINNESTDATNVELSLDELPEGWKAAVKDGSDNLFDSVKPGKKVTTTWLITPPASAAGNSATFTVKSTYFNDCVTKSVTQDATVSVAESPMLSPGSMTATTDSQNPAASEGPVSNVLDGDLATIWHTDYTNATDPYPHWVVLTLNGPSEVNGFGYLGRQSGGMNGKVKDYTVSVSDTGTGGSWEQVASGSLVDTTDMQVIDFPSQTTSFVKFTATSALNGLPFAAAAEMRVFGTTAENLTGHAPETRPADEECGVPGAPLIDAPSAVQAGSDITIGLSGFPANTRLTVTLNPEPFTLGTVTTNADGQASVTATVPADFSTGAHTIQAADESGVLAETAITITGLVVPGGDSGPATPPGQATIGGGLARTGSELALPIGIAMLLIMAGGAASFVLRRRRDRPTMSR